MQNLFRFVVLIIIGLLGGLLFSFSVNIMIMTDILDVDNVRGGFGYEMTSKAVFVWVTAFVLGIISLFIKEKWRYILLLSPLYAPTVFALLYALSQK